MKNLLIEDVLSWERFFKESKKRNFYPPKKIEMFNRLISHTNNFFVIAAIGAFTPGLLQDYSRITQDYPKIYSRITLGLLYKITIFDLSNICKMILLKKSEIVSISVRCLFFGGP